MDKVFLAILILSVSCCTRFERIDNSFQERDIEELGNFSIEGDKQYRILAIEKLARLNDRKSVRYIVKAAQMEEFDVKIAAIKALSDLHHFPEAEQALVSKINDRDPLIRNYLFDRIIVNLAEMRDDQKRILLRKGLADDMIGNQLSATNNLRKLGDYSGGDIVYELLDSNVYAVWRLEAVKQAKYYRDKRIVRKLQDLATDDYDEDIRKSAKEALNFLGIDEKTESSSINSPEKE